jgi:hypothetical protein
MAAQINSLLVLGALLGSVCSLALGGCSIRPQPTTVYRTEHLPDDWLTLPEGDWRVQAQSQTMQSYLARVRENMEAERRSPYFQFYGRYTDATLKQIAEANQLANTAFLTSPKTINSGLSPELRGTAESYDETAWHFAANADANLRALQDDWGRFWLTNRRSSLSSYPMLQTSGQR